MKIFGANFLLSCALLSAVNAEGMVQKSLLNRHFFATNTILAMLKMYGETDNFEAMKGYVQLLEFEARESVKDEIDWQLLIGKLSRDCDRSAAGALYGIFFTYPDLLQ